MHWRQGGPNVLGGLRHACRARVHRYSMGCVWRDHDVLAMGLNAWVGCRVFVESVIPYRTAVGECREVGACLTENKAEPYQWLDPIIIHQTKPDELARLKVVEYAIQERVVIQYTERACGTQQVRRNSGV